MEKCVTRGESCKRKITYHSFSEGSNLCNIFNSNDYLYVIGGGFDIYSIRSILKIY